MRFSLVILAVGLAILALISACSDGDEPIDDAFVPTPFPTVVTTAIATSEETAIPTTVEGAAKEVTSPEMERPVATPRPISVQDEQSATTIPPPLAPSAGPLSLEDLEARQAEGERLEDSWRRQLGLPPGHPYSGAFGSLRTVAMYVDGPLFPNHFRVVGVDDCLKLRVEPHPDAKVINCLPERTVVRQARTFDPHTDGRNTWRVDSTLWRLLANPFEEYRYTDSPIGWADGRYLEDDRDTLPTTPYHNYFTAIDPPPVVHLEVEDSLPAGYLRVTGVDECLDVRAGPSLDSQVLHCLPEGYIMRYRPVGSAEALDRDGILWRFLADPIHLDGWWSRTIGWADTRYLERGESMHPRQELETIALDPIPHVDFPDDIALIYRVSPNLSRNAEGFRPDIPLLRVYKRNGVVTREVLFSFDQPVLRSSGDVDMVMTPDLSRIVVAICHWAACGQRYVGYIYDADPPSPHVTDLYESTDGGVTWHYMDTIPGPWSLGAVSAGNAEGEPQLLLYGYRPEKDGPLLDVGHHTVASMLYPDGERIEFNWTEAGESYDERRQASAEYYRQTVKLRERVLGDRSDRRHLPGYEELEVNQNRNRNFLPALWLSDNEILGDQRYSVIDLFGGAAMSLTHHSSNFDYDVARWPTIYNVKTGEVHPMALPPQALRIADWPYLLAVQHGPFLRVVEVGDGCLPIRAGASPDAEELACMAERVLLQDQGGDVIADDGVTWHKAKTPAGIEGWADGRYLEE